MKQLAAGMFCLLVLLGFFTLAMFLGEAESETKDSLQHWAHTLGREKIESGAYRHYDGEILRSEETETVTTVVIRLPDKDAWGRSLTVTYEKTDLTERLLVHSDGRDGILGTSDDLAHGAKTGYTKTAKAVVREGARQTGAGLVEGAVDAVRNMTKGDKKKQ